MSFILDFQFTIYMNSITRQVNESILGVGIKQNVNIDIDVQCDCTYICRESTAFHLPASITGIKKCYRTWLVLLSWCLSSSKRFEKPIGPEEKVRSTTVMGTPLFLSKKCCKYLIHRQVKISMEMEKSKWYYTY